MQQSKLNIQLVAITPNPIEMVFRGYRVCYSKYSYCDLPLKSDEEMLEFIKKNLLKGHTTPLEHVSVTFSIEGISRAAQQQLTRHRTGKYNVQSQRYVYGANFGYITPKIFIELGLDAEFAAHMEFVGAQYQLFQEKIEQALNAKYGENKAHKTIANENARAVLPMAIDSKMLVTFDLHNLRNFLRQRKCRHAQDEIKEIAFEMQRLVKEHFPIIGVGISNCGSGCDCKQAALAKKKETKPKTKLIFDKAKFIDHQLKSGASLSVLLDFTWPDDAHGKEAVYYADNKTYKVTVSYGDSPVEFPVLKDWLLEVEVNA